MSTDIRALELCIVTSIAGIWLVFDEGFKPIILSHLWCCMRVGRQRGKVNIPLLC